MISINAVIVEDTIANRDTLIKLLAIECEHVQILGSARDIDSAAILIKETKPDLVFLDVELTGNDTGFDLLHQLQQEDLIDFGVIFITGSGNYNYATQAIKYSALEFLEKPIDVTELKKAVDKATTLYNKREINTQLALVLDRVSHTFTPNRKRIGINLIKGVVEMLEIDEILYLEADGVMTNVYTIERPVLRAAKNLGFYGKLLMMDYNFFRISNQLLVNVDHVKTYDHRERAVYLSNGTSLVASRIGGRDFKEYLSNPIRSAGQNSSLLSSFFTSLFKRF